MSFGIQSINVGNIGSEALKDGAVTEAKLAADAVTAAKIKDGEIANADISATAQAIETKITFSDAGGHTHEGSGNAGTKIPDGGLASGVGSGANQILKLDGSGKVPTADIDTGTGANQIVQLDGSSKLPAVDGSQLTNVGGGGAMELMHADVKNVESSSEVEIDTHTFGTNDIANDDTLLIYCDIEVMANGNNASAIIRFYDGTNTIDENIATANAGAHTHSHGDMVVWSGMSDTNICNIFSRLRTAGDISVVDNQETIGGTMISNWLQTAWTISLRGKGGSIGACHWRWKVLKISQT